MALPADVHSTLTRHLSKATANAREGDVDGVATHVEHVESVTNNEVPASPLKERLLHGCAEVEGLAETDPETAAEYLRSMERLVEETDDS
jgi:hypothetical protein